MVQLDAGVTQGLGLRNGAREAVEQVAVGAVGLLQAFLDQADDDVVRHQLAFVHDLFGHFAQLGAGLDGGTQHVAGGNLRDAEGRGDEAGLCALAGTRGAQKNQSHGSPVVVNVGRPNCNALPDHTTTSTNRPEQAFFGVP